VAGQAEFLYFLRKELGHPGGMRFVADVASANDLDATVHMSDPSVLLRLMAREAEGA